jgi:hypothetical protein
MARRLTLSMVQNASPSHHQSAKRLQGAGVYTECIANEKKNDQTDSAVTTVLIHAKRVAFSAKKRRTEASMAKDDDVLKNLVDDHQECQL